MPDGMPSADPAAPAPAPLRSHLPSLDGVRAFSILLVILAHSSTALRRFAYFNDFGTLGVCIFFVISGLLITWLMIRERDATGTFSLRDFYIRRFLRIIPAFWLLILVVTLLRAAGLSRSFNLRRRPGGAAAVGEGSAAQTCDMDHLSIANYNFWSKLTSHEICTKLESFYFPVESDRQRPAR
jgi:hypothetical protein